MQQREKEKNLRERAQIIKKKREGLEMDRGGKQVK